MKKNKKTILAMAAAMVLSVGTFAGISSQPQKDVQCVCAGCIYMAGSSGVGGEIGWGLGSVVAGGIMYDCGKGFVLGLIAGGPVGWGLAAGCLVAGA